MMGIVAGAIIGLIGAFAARLIWAQSAEDLGGFSCVRQLALGAIAGGLYTAMQAQYGLPDGIMTFVAGYAGSDFVEALVQRAKGDL